MLSKEQIKSLFKFCEKHFVPWYEVQVELVDHLASNIEELMTANPQLTFDKALDRTYAGFGIMGFAEITRKKTVQISANLRRMYLHMIAHQFGWPQLIVWLAATVLIYTILNWNLHIGLGTMAIFTLATTVVVFKKERSFSGILNRSGRKFFFRNYFYPAFVPALFIVFWIEVFLFKDIFSNYVLSISLFFGVVMVLFIARFRLIESMKNFLSETYPDAFSFD